MLDDSAYWQQQHQLVQLSRQTNVPHNYARSAAVLSRSSNQTNGNNVPYTVSELAAQFVAQTKSKSAAVSGVNGHLRAQYDAPATSGVGGAAAGASGAGAGYPDPQQKKEQLEEERQRRINEDINKQFWTALDLSGQGLTNITPKLFNYEFLQKLYLNHNKLLALPKCVTKLNQLKVLDLSGNLLVDLPPELGLVFSLRYLFLFDNKLHTLPYELGSLFQLELLGIEGNPLPERTKEIMAREGTRGVIVDLREQAPITIESPPRDWLILDESKPSPESLFTVMSYNTLCDKYATPQMYGYTPSWALGWSYRSDLLLSETTHFMTDIICLQEVDGTTYDEFWSKNLNEKGYAGCYHRKTRARTMVESAAKKVDGCATFYKKEIFKLVEKKGIEYNSLALMRDDFKKSDDVYNRVMNKDNIALITILEHLKSGQLIVVANTHLHWDPAYADVKLVQVGLLLEELGNIVGKYAASNTPEGQKYPKYTDIKNIPMVISGDFNSTVDSGVYQLFSQAKVQPKHPDMEGRHYGKYTDVGVTHKFALKSSYIDELPFSNFTPNFVEVIDYIWYSTQALSVHALLGPMDSEYASHFVGIPNAHHPSDHIPLISQFELKKVKDAKPAPPPPKFNRK